MNQGSQLSLYLETSVISYLMARPRRDLVVAAHQQLTCDRTPSICTPEELM